MAELPALALDGPPMRWHLVGVGGAGMRAIATVLVGLGHQVSGSDLTDAPQLGALRDQGIGVSVGHHPDQVGDVDALAISTAIPSDNPEVIAAHERAIPVYPRWDVSAAIAACADTIAVAGTHGKTTTSSMLALVLKTAALDPSYIIGGDVNELGSGAHWGTGRFLVMEADESDGTFMQLPRVAAIVTNLEPDHLEFYGGEAQLNAAFERFVAETDGPVVMCSDDPGAAALVAVSSGAVTYGRSSGADHQVVDFATDRSGCGWALIGPDGGLLELTLPVPGLHNCLNATAAAVLAIELGVPNEPIVDALARFGGVARRFEPRGAAGGVTFIDDYAHLPTEVAAAIGAARAGDWSRIVTVFQPHRFSRTQALAPTFADAFTDTDVLVVTDIYSSGEAPRPGVSGQLVVDAVLGAHPDSEIVYVPERADLVADLANRLRAGDVCLTLGAGDLTTLPDSLIEAIEEDGGGAER
jgi:UDP-N-acetylmuramate--alanine ligase